MPGGAVEFEAGDIEVLMRLQEHWAGRAVEGDRDAVRVWRAVSEVLDEAEAAEREPADRSAL